MSHSSWESERISRFSPEFQKRIAKMQKNPTTTLAAGILCLACLNSIFIQSGIFGYVILAHTWFLSNAVAAAICALRHGLDDVPKVAKKINDKANFFCGGVTMPFLTAYFLQEGGFSLMALAATLVGIGMASLICVKEIMPDVDRQAVVGHVTLGATFIATGACYMETNITGTAGGVGLILANVILASDKNFGDFSPLDVSLLVLATSNYFFGYATL